MREYARFFQAESHHSLHYRGFGILRSAQDIDRASFAGPGRSESLPL
jgi:hypothetical protein